MSHPCAFSSPPGRRVLALAAVVLAWVGLMTWRLQATTLHVDEFLTCYRTEPSAPLWDAMHPMSYYAFMRWWAQLFGSSDASLRLAGLPWALLAVLSVLVVGWWLLRWPGPLVAVALVCFSSELLLYWRMARYFAPVAGAFALVMVGAVGFLRERRLAWLALMALGTVLCGYFDYLPTIATLLPWAWVIASAVRRGRLASALPALAALVLSLLALLPAIRWVLSGTAQVDARPFAAFSLRNAFLKAGMAGWSLLASETLPPWQMWPAVLTMGGGAVLAGLGVVASWRRGVAWRLVMLVWPAAVALAWIALDAMPNEPPVRIPSLSLHCLPWALLVMALGWQEKSGRWWANVALACFLLGQVVGLTNYFSRRNFLNPQYAMNWREVAGVLRQHVGPRDAVVTFFDAGLRRYYDAPPASQEAFDLHRGGTAKLTELLRAGGRVWLVTRDRGSLTARAMAAEVRAQLRRLGAQERVHGLMPYGPQERLWREALLGSEGTGYYVNVYEFWLPPGRQR